MLSPERNRKRQRDEERELSSTLNVTDGLTDRQTETDYHVTLVIILYFLWLPKKKEKVFLTAYCGRRESHIKEFTPVRVDILVV